MKALLVLLLTATKSDSYFFSFFSFSNSAIWLKMLNKPEGTSFFRVAPEDFPWSSWSRPVLSFPPRSDSQRFLPCKENSLECRSDLREYSDWVEEEESLRLRCWSVAWPFAPGRPSLDASGWAPYLTFSRLRSIASSNLPLPSSFRLLPQDGSPSLMSLLMDCFWLMYEADVLAGAGNQSSSTVLSLQDDTLLLCFLLLWDERRRLCFRFFDFLRLDACESSLVVEDVSEDVEEEVDRFLFFFILDGSRHHIETSRALWAPIRKWGRIKP